MGLLAGTVLGAGLGMLFAPKAGSELRSQIGNQLADQTGRLRDAADQYYSRRPKGQPDRRPRPRGLRPRPLQREQHGGAGHQRLDAAAPARHAPADGEAAAASATPGA